MNENEVLVIGPRNPDIDSVAASIGYAEYKRRTGLPNALAARCGRITDRIAFVLDTFGFEAPPYVPDVSPKIRDVMETNIVHLPPEATLSEALALMDRRGLRELPVLNSERVCQGFVSTFKMSQFLCPSQERPAESRRLPVSVQNLARTLNGAILLSEQPEREEELLMIIGAMNLDSFAKQLPKFPSDKLMVIVGDRPDIQTLAVRARVRLLVITGGTPADGAVEKEAGEAGVSIVLSPHDTLTTALLCRSAIAVQHLTHKDFLAFRADDPLLATQKIATASPYQAFPVLDAHKAAIGIVSKSDFLKKPRRRLILVDHNELSQAVPGADELEILEIIDHHRLGVFTTRHPIFFRNEPVGSTCTIVADCFLRDRLVLPQPLAGLLLAGLVSDTLNLTSPATTPRDRELVRQLEKIASISATEFTRKLFASNSILSTQNATEALLADCKEFHEENQTFCLSQIEDLGFEQFWKRKDDVLAALESHRRRKNYHFAALLITDVLKQGSLLAIAAPSSLLDQIVFPLLEPAIYDLEGVVSREQQLLPYLTQCLAKSQPPRPNPAEPTAMV